MKKFLLLSLFCLSFQALAAGEIADFSKKSVVFLIKVNDESQAKNVIKDQYYPLFKKLKAERFANNNAHFLIQDLELSFKALSVVAKRKIADYDLMVRIDLKSDLTSEQEKSLFLVREELKRTARDMIIFLSDNTQFHRVNGTEKTDTAMAFINRWHPDMSYQAAQKYWIENHGPLVIQVGLPPTVRSYTQIHVNTKARQDIFDRTIQGLSFETISSQTKFVIYFIKNPEVKKLNERLLEDEVNFTPPPELFAFTSWKI